MGIKNISEKGKTPYYALYDRKGKYVRYIGKDPKPYQDALEDNVRLADLLKCDPSLLADERNRTAVKRIRNEAERQRERKLDSCSLTDVPPIPLGPFATIILDPPWDWGDEGDIDQFGRDRPTYSTMTIDEVESLPIISRSAPDCHLYLWITNRSMPKGFRLFETWGFRYITLLTWSKVSSTIVYRCRKCYNLFSGGGYDAVQGQTKTSGLCTSEILSPEGSGDRDTGISPQDLRTVPCAIHCPPERDTVLQQGLPEQTPVTDTEGKATIQGGTYPKLQGQYDKQRLQASLSAEFTDGEPRGLCAGTPFSDVPDCGQATSAGRGSSPQESGQGGQPTRKPRTNQLSGSWNGTPHKNSNMPQLQSCIRCGGILQRFVTPTNPGMGNYFRGSTEHIMFGVKGSLPLLRHDVGTTFNFPRGNGHSTKPDEMYGILATCSPEPRLEMFARKPHAGWLSWPIRL